MSYMSKKQAQKCQGKLSKKFEWDIHKDIYIFLSQTQLHFFCIIFHDYIPLSINISILFVHVN